MHLSAELEWAQFLVIMVVGFLLLWDCVLNRKAARKLEGFLERGDIEGMLASSPDQLASVNSGGAMAIRAAVLSDRQGSNTYPNAAMAYEGFLAKEDEKDSFLGSMEAPVFYPYSSKVSSKQKSREGRKMKVYMSAYDAARKGGASEEAAEKVASEASYAVEGMVAAESTKDADMQLLEQAGLV